jgi:hypothetical protein
MHGLCYTADSLRSVACGCKEFLVGRLSDCVLVIVLAGALVGLMSCEQQVPAARRSVAQVTERRSVDVNSLSAGLPPGESKTPVAAKAVPSAEQAVVVVEPNLPPGPPADNSLCLVCHVNFEKESLTVVHARCGVGCTRCHGPSDAHRLDEDCVTPPDVMFAKSQIRAFCAACHAGAAMDIPAHKDVLAEPDPLKACCTDCHGEHRLNYRTRRWDKITRRLIKDERVRRLSDEIRDR